MKFIVVNILKTETRKGETTYLGEHVQMTFREVSKFTTKVKRCA